MSITLADLFDPAELETMTTDDLKLQRDGHLEYGKVPSSKHQWVRPVYRVVEVTETSVYVTLDDGLGVLEWKR